MADEIGRELSRKDSCEIRMYNSYTRSLFFSRCTPTLCQLIRSSARDWPLPFSTGLAHLCEKPKLMITCMNLSLSFRSIEQFHSTYHTHATHYRIPSNTKYLKKLQIHQDNRTLTPKAATTPKNSNNSFIRSYLFCIALIVSTPFSKSSSKTS